HGVRMTAHEVHQLGDQCELRGLRSRCLYGFGFRIARLPPAFDDLEQLRDRKSTRLNSSHVKISYAVFCLKKKNKPQDRDACHHHLIHARILAFSVFNNTSPTECYTLSLHDALPISWRAHDRARSSSTW